MSPKHFVAHRRRAQLLVTTPPVELHSAESTPGASWGYSKVNIPRFSGHFSVKS
jgi:hypothetical protein